MDNKIIQSILDVLSQLETLESPLLIAEIVLTALMAHSLKKVNVASNTPSVDSTSAVESSSDTLPSKKEVKSAKKQVKEQLLADIELFFSEKSDEEMTDDERARCAAVLAFMEAKK